MVRKYEESITDATSGATSSSERTNGTASYADSLKLELKKQAPSLERQTSAENLPCANHHSPAGDNNENSSSSDCNVLLNELVVEVTSNVQPNSRPFVASSKSNHATGSSNSTGHSTGNSTSNSLSNNSAGRQMNMPNQVLHQFAGSNSAKPDKKRAAFTSEPSGRPAPSASSSKTSQPAQPTISTLSTKQVPKGKEPLVVDCVKKKIRTQITENDARKEFIEVLFFIKGIAKETLKVNFQEKSLAFKFKTADSAFLRDHNISLEPFRATYTMHRITNGTINGESTEENKFNQLKPEIDKTKLPTFAYTIETLFDKVLPEECSYELTDNHLKIRLKKKISIKWNALEMARNEMCVNYLKNIANVQKESSAYKYKPAVPVNKSSNISKLLSNYEKPAERTSPGKASDEDSNNNDDKQNSDAIPIPPPLPNPAERHQRFKFSPIINGDSHRRSFAEKKEEVTERLLNDLIISPVKPDNEVDNYQKFRRSIPLSFHDDDAEAKQPAMQPPSLRLNLAEARGRIGYTGLSNLGNTCYMNSCLQCLSNTVELRDYFLNEQYREDLNKENPFGSGGHLAEAFSELLYKLWLGDSSCFSPTRFKRLIDENCSQFIGYSQHDSVEFMEHFLDVLHEDLNRVDRKNVKPASPIENEDELNDEQLANEQWLRHRQRNDSIITELFYGQYKSKLVCPKCSKVSITFDPFLYLPIPLTNNKIVYNLYLFSLNHEKPPERMSVKLPQGSKFSNLLEVVCSRTGLERARLIACQISQHGELEQEFRMMNFIPDSLAKTRKLHIYQKPDDRSLNKFIVHQTIPGLAEVSIDLTGKCDFCNRPLSKPNLKPKNCPKCKVAYCGEKCLNDDYPLHKCKEEPVLVGWPSMFFEYVGTTTYNEFMTKLEALALKSVQVVETELPEEQPEHDVHLGQEVREGQELEENGSHAVAEDEEGLQKEAMECEDSAQENPDMTSSSQEERFDSPMADASPTTADSSFGKETEKEEEPACEMKERDSGFRFVLMGKSDELRMQVKRPVYIPKDDSDVEQKRFRESLRNLYFLFIDWKERYGRPDEEGKLRNYSLSVLSRNLDMVATGGVANNLEQEKTECTLQDLMTKFTEPETLSTQEAWICPTCKEPRTASKELTIWRPPKILVIQLKRFSYSTYSREKIDKFVSYPVKGLDISKFCTDSKLLAQTQPIYDLYAVIDHFGGLYGGHYTANANSSVNNKDLGWRAFNDSSVRDIDKDGAISRSAYVLFYRLRSNVD